MCRAPSDRGSEHLDRWFLLDLLLLPSPLRGAPSVRRYITIVISISV